MTDPEDTGPVASLKAVGHRYGKVAALDDVTLGIPTGRMVGLIGPDGGAGNCVLRSESPSVQTFHESHGLSTCRLGAKDT